MPSPPRQPQGSPRRALHERTDSQANERLSRHSWKSEVSEKTYQENNLHPNTTLQILRPSYQYPSVKGLQVEGAEDQDKQAWGVGSDGGPSSQRSSADLTLYNASRPGSAAFALPTQESSESPFASSRVDASIRQVTNEEPSIAVASEETPADRVGIASLADRQPSNKESENSLSSTNTTGTVVRKHRDGKKRASYSAFPYTGRPSSSKSSLAAPASQKSSSSILKDQESTKFSVSPTTLDFGKISPHERSDSSDSAGTGSAGENSLTRLQYPIIKPPVASGSWAESSIPLPFVPPRAAERAQQRWNPHLSTVPSEGRSSVSGEQTSQGVWLSDSSRASKSSSNVLGPRFSSDRVPLPVNSEVSSSQGALSRDSVRSPPPSLPTVRSRDFSGSTIRIVDEEAIPKLVVPPTIPGSRDSADIEPARSTLRTSEPVQRPSSSASFFRDSIPAWAKSYYARPVSSSSSSPQRDSTATENISINVFRPRTRRLGVNGRPDRRISGLNMHPTHSDSNGPANLVDIHRPQGISPRWSPHLWHDRMSLSRRRSLFKAPSIDEGAEESTLTKRNAQVMLFAFGFAFPLAWFMAACLPLPRKPKILSSKGKSAVRETQICQDLEKHLDPTDLARYENARWWRQINRIMCAPGLVIILIIIILAPVAAT